MTIKEYIMSLITLTETMSRKLSKLVLGEEATKHLSQAYNESKEAIAQIGIETVKTVGFTTVITANTAVASLKLVNQALNPENHAAVAAWFSGVAVGIRMDITGLSYEELKLLDETVKLMSAAEKKELSRVQGIKFWASIKEALAEAEEE